jgi:hypothetical protein
MVQRDGKVGERPVELITQEIKMGERKMENVQITSSVSIFH